MGCTAALTCHLKAHQITVHHVFKQDSANAMLYLMKGLDFGSTLPWVGKVDPLPPVPELRAAREGSDLLAFEALDGIPIAVRVFGSGGRLTPVILLHGLQSHSGWFVQSARFISRIGHPVYAADRRGSGLSPARRGHVQNYERWIEDILALREFIAVRHKTKKIHLLGHCFGAVPALAFASRHPNHLRSLILTTPALYTHTDLTIIDKVRVLMGYLDGGDRYIPVPLRPEEMSDLPAFREFIGADPLALRSATARFWAAVFQARRAIGRNFRNLSMPIFMAVSARDPVSDTEANLRFLCRLPSGCKWAVRYERSLHVLEFGKDRDDFFRDLAGWLERVSR